MFDRARESGGVPVSESPSKAGPTTVWREIVGAEEEIVVQRGRLADLLVVARPTAQMEVPSAVTFNAAVFESGRPVLVAPLEPPASLGRRVAISWNGSAEAARAVSAALPFITRAEAVCVLSVDGDDLDGEGSADLLEFLAWHGVSAENRVVAKGEGSVGASIVAACADADLLVMGAYTHSRLRELIMGGVTRHVLEQATPPLLMAH
jgi:nucleotide-binding universal stress UspA family protein